MRHIAFISNNFQATYTSWMLTELQKNLLRGQEQMQKLILNGDRGLGLNAEERQFSAIVEWSKVCPASVISISIQPDQAAMNKLLASGIHVVLTDERMPGASTVASDNTCGGVLAADHFASNGRKNFAIVCGATKVRGGYNARLRLEGFSDACRKHGMHSPVVREVFKYSFDDGRDTVREWADALRSRRIDAIFCAAGDDCAAGVLTGLRAIGLSAPDDVAIIGYDDIEPHEAGKPGVAARHSLTTIKQPLAAIAKVAHELATDPPQRPVERILKPQLVVRSSTAYGMTRAA